MQGVSERVMQTASLNRKEKLQGNEILAKICSQEGANADEIGKTVWV